MRENKKVLKQLNHPIMRIQAEYDCLPGKRSFDKSADACSELEKPCTFPKNPKLCCVKIATQCGLVNGSVGFVKLPFLAFLVPSTYFYCLLLTIQSCCAMLVILIFCISQCRW